MPLIRVYIDTSVFGGRFDPEFTNDSEEFFQTILKGKIKPLISETLIGEITYAPIEVRELLEQILNLDNEHCALTPEVIDLHEAYLKAGVTPSDVVKMIEATNGTPKTS